MSGSTSQRGSVAGLCARRRHDEPNGRMPRCTGLSQYARHKPCYQLLSRALATARHIDFFMGNRGVWLQQQSGTPMCVSLHVAYGRRSSSSGSTSLEDISSLIDRAALRALAAAARATQAELASTDRRITADRLASFIEALKDAHGSGWVATEVRSWGAPAHDGVVHVDQAGRAATLLRFMPDTDPTMLGVIIEHIRDAPPPQGSQSLQ